MPNTILTLKEATRYLHLNERDVLAHAKGAEIPVRWQRGKPLFRKCDLDRWAQIHVMNLSGRNLCDYHRESSTTISDLRGDHAVISDLTGIAAMIPALSSRTKPSLIRDMVEKADKTGWLNYPEDLLELLIEREKLASTAMCGGFALLHPQYHEPYLVDKSFILVARTEHPIPFGAPDGKMTDVFMLLCAQDDWLHLHVLARLCMLARDYSLLDMLRAAEGAREMYAVVQDLEQQLVATLRK